MSLDDWIFGNEISISNLDLTDEIGVANEKDRLLYLKSRLNRHEQFSLNFHNKELASMSVCFTGRENGWKISVFYFGLFLPQVGLVSVDWLINLFIQSIGDEIYKIILDLEM